MNGRPERNPRLDELLEALCEDRLSAAETRELERIVLSDPSARRAYFEYVELHGNLYWDAAIGGGSAFDASSISADVDVVEAPQRTRTAAGTAFAAVTTWPRSTRVRLAIGAVAVVASVALIAVGMTFERLRRPHGIDPRRSTAVAGTEAARTTVAETPPESGAIGAANPAGPLAMHAPPRSFDPTPSATIETRTDAETSGSAPAVETPVETVAEGGSSTAAIVAAIDGQLQASWTLAGVEPSPAADDPEWLRRVYLDVVGRIPTVAEAERYLASPGPDRRRRLIDELLDSPDYARHWSAIWTNLLVGRSNDRDVDRAALERFLDVGFQRNRPWDETVRTLVSAEGDSDAANFLVAHVGSEAVPATAIASRLFLGMQVQCTQCHDHPFNDWKQNQFWELNSFFAQTRVVQRTQTDPRTGRKTVTRELANAAVGGPTFFETRRQLLLAALPKFEGRSVDPGPETDRRAALGELITSGSKPQLADAFVNRVWSQFFGCGFTRPVDDMGPHNPPSHPALLERLSREFVASGYDVKQLVRWIGASQAYQRSSRPIEGNLADDPSTGASPLFSRVYVKMMSAEQLYDSLLVATRADSAGRARWIETQARRQAWLQQFVVAYHTEEHDESSTFDGSIPQALMMMNGDLTGAAVAGEPGTFLHDVAALPGDDAAKIRRLALSALCREPRPEEIAAVRQVVRKRTAGSGGRGGREQAAVDGLQDLFWAYLNSNEFIHVH